MRKLYFGYISPYSRKIRVVLAEKGLDYEQEILHFGSAPKSADAVNPARRVPVLVDGDRSLFESNVIIDYLLHTYPDNGLPDSPPLAEGLARPEHRWDDWQTLVGIETMLDSGLNLLFLRNDGITPEHSTFLGRELNRTQVLLDWLEQRATPEGFMPGRFSIQDMNFIIAVQWSDYRHMFPWRGRPKLEAIVERFKNRPSMATTTPEMNPPDTPGREPDK